MILRTSRVHTPIGEAWLCASPTGLSALGLGPDAEPRLLPRLFGRFPDARVEHSSDPEGIATRLAGYFEHHVPLDGLSLDPGGTRFEERVWQHLRAIPPGETLSYAALAARLGRPTAARAVARANARNPIALAIPCHRVVGSDGALRGYAWGVERKAWLLAHEARARVGERARDRGERRDVLGSPTPVAH